jgi:hypothetical protein
MVSSFSQLVSGEWFLDGLSPFPFLDLVAALTWFHDFSLAYDLRAGMGNGGGIASVELLT